MSKAVVWRAAVLVLGVSGWVLAGGRALAAAEAGGPVQAAIGALQGLDPPAFSLRPSDEGATRETVEWRLAGRRVCALEGGRYDRRMVCWELEPGRGAVSVRYRPVSPSRVVYLMGFGPGDYVKAFTRTANHGWWFQGGVMPGVGGAPLSVLLFLQHGDGLMLTATSQPRCAGCQ